MLCPSDSNMYDPALSYNKHTLHSSLRKGVKLDRFLQTSPLLGVGETPVPDQGLFRPSAKQAPCPDRPKAFL